MELYQLFIILFISILIVYLYFENALVIYTMKRVIYGEDEAGSPTPFQSRKDIKSIIESIAKTNMNMTLVDFGCGQGDFIQYMKENTFLCKLIGVEMDQKHVDKCMERFKTDSKIEIYHQNMIDFIFPKEPIILYMYVYCIFSMR